MNLTLSRVPRVHGFFMIGAIGVIALVMATMPLGASAHETRTVADDYEFVVGFVNEPAVVDEFNGIWLSVASGDEPVEGLADTLQAEVLLGEETLEAPLRPSHGEPGVYVSNFIPTAESDYTFHFFGEIDGVEVDETFTSSPEGFDSVAPRSDFEFPAAQEEGSAERTVAMPVLVGVVLAALGGIGFAVRRQRA
ncbi:MAG: hypothetical protein H0U38_10965 [Chloroflexia bacterium]|jgi:hypothetical protein|nr:hypothetical protein [Chloroflexia bacterium]